MNIREITRLDELHSLRPDWERLAAASDAGFPFLAPSFMLPWLKFCEGRHKLRFLAAYDSENQLVGLAPLVSRRVGFGPLRLSIIGFPVSGTTPPMDFLTAKDSPEVGTALLDYLIQRKDWDLLWLHQVADGSPLLENLKQRHQSKQLATVVPQKNLTYILPIRSDWNTFFRKCCTKKLRNNIERGWRNLEKEGVTTIKYYPEDGMTLDSALSMVWSVLGASWKDISEQNRRSRRFFEDLTHELDASGQLGLRFVCLDEIPVAYMLEIVYRNAMFPFHNGYDARFQRYGPGQLILSEVNRWSFDHQLRHIDYLGYGEYISHWTQETRTLSEIRATRSSLARLKAYLYFRIRDYRYQRVRAVSIAHRDAVKQNFRQG